PGPHSLGAEAVTCEPTAETATPPNGLSLPDAARYPSMAPMARNAIICIRTLRDITVLHYRDDGHRLRPSLCTGGSPHVATRVVRVPPARSARRLLGPLLVQ